MINIDFIKTASKAVCINNEGVEYLTLNKKYYIQECYNDLCLVYNDAGVLHTYVVDRFEIIK